MPLKTSKFACSEGITLHPCLGLHEHWTKVPWKGVEHFLLGIWSHLLFFPLPSTRPGQRESMGQLEYQTMPSLGEVVVTFTTYTTAARNSISSSCQGNRSGTEKASRYDPSITYIITPAGSLSGGPPFWAIPLAFGLIVPACWKQTCRPVSEEYQLG